MAQSDTLDIIFHPAVGADARVLICGSAPDVISRKWPLAVRELPSPGENPRFELAIFADPLAGATAQAAEQMLAAARDRWSQQVLALVPLRSKSHALESIFFSLGFTHLPLPSPLKEDYVAYGFSISHYKTTPDWLNSKYWANPERWGKR